MPKSSRGEQTRAQIRRAAYELFREQGYHATSVEMICERAGSSKGSFYWHFPAKQDVFVDLLTAWGREIMEEIYVQFEDAAKRGGDFLDATAEALEREQHRGLALVPIWLEFTLLARTEPDIQRALATFYRRGRAAIADVLRPVTPAYTDAQRRSLASAIFGLYTGVIMQALADPEEADAGDQIAMFMSLLGRWLAAARSGGAFDSSTVLDRPVRSPGARVAVRDLESLLSRQPDVADLFGQVRGKVLELVPTADERLIRGWGQLAYGHDVLFCSLKPRHDSVEIGFDRGAELPDPEGLLRGRGKKKRHVVLRLGGPLPEGIEALILEAERLNQA